MLLEQVGIQFIQSAAEADETWPDGKTAEKAVQELARRKAEAVAGNHPDAVILAADTIVRIDGDPLGKPSSPEDALDMLERLAGREHIVTTGIVLQDTRTGESIADAVNTHVVMRPATREELQAYVATEEPMDKAGAYGIQGYGAGLVTSISGCYFNVVGLPLARTIQHIQRLSENRCRLSSGDDCAVSDDTRVLHTDTGKNTETAA